MLWLPLIALVAAQTGGPWRLEEALHAPEWLTISGSHRTRYSDLLGQFRAGLDDDDRALSLRTLLKVELGAKALSIVGELQDSRAYLLDENSGASTIEINALSLLQAYLNLKLKDAVVEGATLELRLGRQTIDLGGRRLIARNRFRNTIQSYTGVTSRWARKDGVELFALFVLPIRILPANSDREALLDNKIALDRERFDLRLWGAHLRWPKLDLGALEALDVVGELYLFGLNQDDARALYTPGARLSRAPQKGALDFDIELVLQLGHRGPPEARQAVFALFHHLSLGYTLDVWGAPRLSAELDYASGDQSPGDDRYGRFDSLFGPRRAEFGPTGIYGILGRENTLSQGLRLSWTIGQWLDGYLSWRANHLAQASDAFSRSGVKDPLGRSGRFGGHQLELRTRLWIIQGTLRWELGGAVFFRGRFLREAPAAAKNGDPRFFYTDLSLMF